MASWGNNCIRVLRTAGVSRVGSPGMTWRLRSIASGIAKTFLNSASFLARRRNPRSTPLQATLTTPGALAPKKISLEVRLRCGAAQAAMARRSGGVLTRPALVMVGAEGEEEED